MLMFKYENVTFLIEPAQKLKREEFIAQHLHVFWQDRPEEIRKEMLGNAHDLIMKRAKKSKK